MGFVFTSSSIKAKFLKSVLLFLFGITVNQHHGNFENPKDALFDKSWLESIAGARKVIRDFSAKTFLNFFSNHKLLNFFDRPQWKTVSGGSKKYIEAVEKKLKGKVEKNSNIISVKKQKDGIRVVLK